MDEATLKKDVFPKLAQRLADKGELYVPYDYATHFVHWLMHTNYELWLRTEQEVAITDDNEARLYLRDV